ncbi:hypothetical protein C8A03DRAFT_16622 [Achaetomium macrosporum]|uniref:Thioredoxin-like protein n=1 Tax=Achaetomium macrosporum TaxID=79813 RepID=A0AAN7C7Q8_9PEZI|nr:hypothetical protein C8A03DRAFT_16622 [Achaetomium macrosporum]
MTSEASESKSYSTDPALYIYTSLTAGSSHIVTATSRLETILRANRVPFKAIDIATDEKARMLWGRRAGKDASGRQRKLPGLVQMGMVLGDLVEIEEWNEYGELKDHVTFYYDEFTQPSISQAPKPPPAAAAAAPPAKPAAPPAAPPAPAPAPKSTAEKVAEAASTAANKVTLPVRSIAEEAAAKAKQVHLQSLRDKVYGKGGSSSTPATTTTTPDSSSSTKTPTEPTSKDKDDKPTETAPAPAAAHAGLQSPTSSGWKAPPSEALTIQSPTTTGWRPAEPAVTELHGAPLASASAEEITAVERAEMIPEEPEKEEEESEEEDDDEQGDGEEEKEAVKKE